MSEVSPGPRVLGALALAAVVLLGAGVRSLDLAHPSVSYDELSDLAQSVTFCARANWSEPAADGYLNGQLPFTLACVLYRWFPPDPLIPRAQAVVFGVLTILTTFLLATRFVSRGWALLAAGFVAASPLAIAASRLGFSHGHGIQVPFVLLGLHLALGGSPRRLWMLFASGLSLGVAVGVDLLAAFTLPSAAGWVLYASRHDGSVARPAASFAAGAALGVALSSPMYVVHPLLAAASVAERLGQWDDLRGYLWLGDLRDRIPAYYYGVVLALKANPVVLAAAAAGAVIAIVRPTRERVFLCASLWPIAYLSVKGWKSPFYVVSFEPLVAVLAALAVGELSRWRGRAAAALVASAALVSDAWCARAVHPDWLMAGIQWSEALYGEFQGPAVSHGQWIGEALEYIKTDAAGGDPLVLVPRDIARPQLGYYARALELGQLDDSGWADPRVRAWVEGQTRYVVLTQDCLRLVSPLHPDAVRSNAELASLVRPPSPFRLAKAFGPAAFPMVWVFRRAEPIP